MKPEIRKITIEQLEILYRVLIEGTEAVDPKWDRMKAASAVERALEVMRADA